MALIEGQSDSSKRRDYESAKRGLPFNLADDEIHEAMTCPEHGQMNWYKGKYGEQIFVCTKCKE